MKSAGFSLLGRRTAEPPISWLMKMTLERPKLISLAAGFTDRASLPVREVGEILHEILFQPKVARSALQYGSTTGDETLRRLTMERLQAGDGLLQDEAGAYSPRQLLITHGSQQLLYLLTECLCDPGDIILVEDPTYFVFLGIVQSHGLRCRGLRLQSDGLDLARLEAVLGSLKKSGGLARVKMLFMVSYFQNPSGVTTSLEKKRAALELLRSYESAAGHPIYLIEDAAYRDLRFAGDDVPSALAVPGFGDRVIYAGTYSKPFATGIRVGYGRLPESLFTVINRVKGNHDFGTSNLLQQVLRQGLSSGRYDQHLALLRRRYRKKARVMVEALQEHFPKNIQWEAPRGGLYVWARLPRALSAGTKSRLFQKALSKDVLYVPGELCYAPDATRRLPRNEMRLSFGSAGETEIRTGIARLGQVLRTL